MLGKMTELRDSSVMLQLAYQAMLNMDIDVNKVLSQIGATPELLEDRNARTPHEAQLLFWRVMEEVSEDPDIGLHLGEHMPVYKGQVLQYLFLSSPTFGEGLNRALNYQRLLSDASVASLGSEGEKAYIVVDTTSKRVVALRHLNECMALGLIRFFNYVTDSNFQPTLVCFKHPQPESIKEHQRIFNCELLFEQEENRIYFDADLLKHPS